MKRLGEERINLHGIPINCPASMQFDVYLIVKSGVYMWLFRKVAFVKRIVNHFNFLNIRVSSSLAAPHIVGIMTGGEFGELQLLIRDGESKSNFAMVPIDLYNDIDLLCRFSTADIAVINGFILQQHCQHNHVKFIELKRIYLDENNEQFAIFWNHMTKDYFRKSLKQLEPDYPLLSLIPSHQAKKLSLLMLKSRSLEKQLGQ